MGNTDYSVRLPDEFVNELTETYPAATSVPDAVRMACQEAVHHQEVIILETGVEL